MAASAADRLRALLAAPDTGLISYAEMRDQGRDICGAVSIPVIGDADTGYGNALNVKRTVEGYAQAGFAGLMIEDQLAPKRCGHTRAKRSSIALRRSRGSEPRSTRAMRARTS